MKRYLIWILLLTAQLASAQDSGRLDAYGFTLNYSFTGGTIIMKEEDLAQPGRFFSYNCEAYPGDVLTFSCSTDNTDPYTVSASLSASTAKPYLGRMRGGESLFEKSYGGGKSASFSYTVPDGAGSVGVHLGMYSPFKGHDVLGVGILFTILKKPVARSESEAKPNSVTNSPPENPKEVNATTSQKSGETSEEENPTSSNEGLSGIKHLLGGLLSWLRGEDDPLGLGEHTDARESAIVCIAGVLLSLLLGGLAGGAGGTAPIVPPASPVDPTKFTPTYYPDYCKQFITQQPDGDVVMKSPATGQNVHYYSNGDGTWFTESGMTYTAEDIEERLRYEAENAGYVRQNAETAARNVAAQRAAWEAQNARDLVRGYSDEMKEYRDWKQQQENQVRHEEYLEKMSWKYHVPPTDKAIKDAIKFEQAMNRIDADTYNDLAKQLDKSINRLQTVEKVCDFGIGVLGSCVPGGTAVKNAYTFAKSTLVAASESFVESKSLDEAAAHILIGMGDGALGVIQNEAGDLAGEGKLALVKEWGINVLTEDLKEGMKVIADSETWKGGFLEGMDKLGRTFISTTGKKTAGFGLGKVVSGGLGFLKDTATASLNPDGVEMGKFCFNVSTAKRIDYWLNKSIDVAAGGKNIGTIENGKAVEELANNALSWVGFSDKVEQFGSDTANWINDFGSTCDRIDVLATNFNKKW